MEASKNFNLNVEVGNEMPANEKNGLDQKS